MLNAVAIAPGTVIECPATGLIAAPWNLIQTLRLSVGSPESPFKAMPRCQRGVASNCQKVRAERPEPHRTVRRQSRKSLLVHHPDTVKNSSWKYRIARLRVIGRTPGI